MLVKATLYFYSYLLHSAILGHLSSLTFLVGHSFTVTDQDRFSRGFYFSQLIAFLVASPK